MNTLDIIKLKQILSYHPKVIEIREGGDEIGESGELYVTTNENPDDSDDCSFGNDVLDMLGVEWISNDCEGCYNEYMIK